MKQSDLLTGNIAATLVAAALLGGCVSAPPSSLQQAKASMMSRLTAQCYWEHDGERYLFGPGPVWSACRRWATAAVKVQFGHNTPVLGVHD